MSVLVIIIVTHLSSLGAVHVLDVKARQLPVGVRTASILFSVRRNCRIWNDASPSTVSCWHRQPRSSREFWPGSYQKCCLTIGDLFSYFLLLFSRKVPGVTFLSQLAHWGLVLKGTLANLPSSWNPVPGISDHLSRIQKEQPLQGWKPFCEKVNILLPGFLSQDYILISTLHASASPLSWK